MWPTLISIGPLAIHSFGVMMAVGVFLGGFGLWLKGKEEGFDEEKLMDSWIVAGISSLAFARLFYVFLNYDQFGSWWYKALFLTKFPGLSYIGAFVGAMLALIFMSKKFNWSFWAFSEVLIFGLLTVEIFGWIGAFLVGSIEGRQTDFWWGIRFPGNEVKGHPISLLFLLGLIIWWFLLKRWAKRYRTFSWYQHKKEEALEGFLLAVYLIGLGLVNLIVGFLIKGQKLWGLMISQWFGLALLLTGGLILVWRSGIKEKLKGAANKEPVNRMAKFKSKRKKKGFDFR